MAINVDAVRNWEFPVLTQTYSEKDTILYALALGYGTQNTDPGELKFVYEKDLEAVPTMAATLCYPGFWVSDPRTGIDAAKVVHGEQKMVWHRPLKAKGTLKGTTRVVEIIDKGKDKGAVLIFARDLFDAETDELIVSLQQTSICRGDGGFSGKESSPSSTSKPGPESNAASPDNIVDIQVLPQASLIYRLSADLNPLHADPEAARAGGFRRPILHGMCTYGLAARAVIEAYCCQDPSLLKSLSGRFSAPVYSGEMLRTQMWVDGATVRFECSIPSRNITVFSNGVAELRC